MQTLEDQQTIEHTRNVLLTQESYRRYCMYDHKDKRPIRSIREHRAIVIANFGGATDGQEPCES